MNHQESKAASAEVVSAGGFARKKESADFPYDRESMRSQTEGLDGGW